MKAFKESQVLKHAIFGVGVVTESTPDRTTIDFETFGKKKFVTSMVQVELLEGDRPKPSRARGRKKAASAAAALAIQSAS